MTRMSARGILEPKVFLFGDNGNGWQRLGKTRTYADAERVWRELAWVYRLKIEEIELLEGDEQDPEAHRGIC